VTVHVVETPGLRLVGLQTSEDTTGLPPPPVDAALKADIWARYLSARL
jgi:hypothetical protein